jgi:RNA polymerase sigma-70 factor, ECF subfamily
MSLPARRSPTPKEVAIVEPLSLAEIAKEREFLDFYDRHRQSGIRYAEHFVGSQSADDIVQSISLSMWKHWETLTLEQRSRRYFMSAVRNGIISELRHENRYVELTEEVEERPDFPTVVIVSEETQREDLLRWLREMIKRMPTRRREVFLLVKEFEFTYEETAEALGISIKTVDAQMQKAREYFEQGAEHGGIRLTRETMRKLLPPPPKRLPPPRMEGSNDE